MHGGFHSKSHIGCIISNSIIYTGNAYASQFIHLGINVKCVCIVIILIYAITIVKKYAPADTEEVPIISKKERKKRKYISYLIVVTMIFVSCIIKNERISNMILIGIFFQTFAMTKLAYKITRNKYGYEEYLRNGEIVIN